MIEAAAPPPDLAKWIHEIGRGPHAARPLDTNAARELCAAMLDGTVPPLELGAILLAYRVKGETVDELTGFMTAIDRQLARLASPPGALRPVLLPCYNGARRLPNLTPLVALLPKRYGVPVLLHGMEHASVQTRRECFRELRRRTELEDTFPITAGPEIRRAAIQTLAREWNLPKEPELTPTGDAADAKVNRLRIEELRQYLLDAMNPEFPENAARHQAAIRASDSESSMALAGRSSGRFRRQARMIASSSPGIGLVVTVDGAGGESLRCRAMR